MALLFLDGFSHYQTSDILRKWTAKVDTDVTWTIEPAGGRNGGCLKRQSTGNAGSAGYLYKSPTWRQTGPWTPQVSGVCGFACKVFDLERTKPPAGFLGKASDGAFFAVWNGTWPMFTIVLGEDGTLTLWRISAGGSSGTILDVSIGALIEDSWTYLEFKWTINSGTAGSMIIRSNGVEVMNYTGQLYPSTTPLPPPSAEWTSVYCFGSASDTSPYLLMRMCDFYLLDTTGALHNDFLGDISVSYIRPNAPGGSALWTPNSAVANWTTVDEVPGNDDTDYNSALDIGKKDTYEFENLNVNTVPIAVQHCMLARRVVPGSATLSSIVGQSGTDYEGVAQAILNETYAYSCFPYDTNPATGAVFTKTEIDNGQFGVNKVT